jgi:sugar lactone lactonase YvrE
MEDARPITILVLQQCQNLRRGFSPAGGLGLSYDQQERLEFSMFLLTSRRVFSILSLLLIAVLSGEAQSPIALPYTMTTLAGSAPMTAASGTQCPGLATGVRSTDAYGDGCLATNGIFGAAGRGGVVADAFGNVFVADDVDAIIHMVNGSTGIMTTLAGNGAVCSAKKDSAGDGCLAATQTVTKGQRGIGIDAYGNVLLAGYSDNLVHVVCRTASPLCSAAQIGYMELVAGCVGTSGGGATAGVGADNVQAAQVGVGTCSPAGGEVDAPRGAWGDIYGNVYFADTSSSRTRVVVGPKTSSYFTGTNPLYAALGVYYASVTQGYVYSVVNTSGTGTGTGGTATALAQSCSVTTNGAAYTGTALDALGDGCPFEFSSVSASSGYTSGVSVDAAGNMLFTDPVHGLRVFFVTSAGTAGAAMAKAISTNNTGVTPQPGFIYMLAGGGATALSATPTLGTSTAVSDTTTTKLDVSPQGNVYIGDSSKVLFYDINTGYIRLLLSSGTNVAAGSYCSGSSGQKSLSAYSDACPAAKSLFSNNNGLGIATDGPGNLYLYDASSNTSGMLVRKILAQGLAAQTVGTPLIQTLQVHLPQTAAGTVAGSTAALSATADITATTPACAQNGDFSVDCTVAVTTTPSAAGARSATLTVALPAGTWTNPIANVALNGTATGSVLALDNASTTKAAVTTAVAPSTNSVFSSIVPAGVALDGAGNVYAMDSQAGSIVESIGGAAYTLAATLPTNPGQLAVDAVGNVFAVGKGTTTIEELKVSGPPASAAAPSTLTATTVAYTPSAGTAAPQAIAVDLAGNLFVADYQASGSSVYRLSQVANTAQFQTTVVTGLSNPVSLAVDGLGNVYVADKTAGAVYKLMPGVTGAYTQSTLLAGITPVAVAVDPAGDVYVQDQASESVIEIPAAGPTTVSVLNGLTTPVGLAVDGKGDVFSADAHNTSVTEVVRSSVSYNFGTDESTTFAGTLTNVGNQAASGSNPVTNTTNFAVVAGASNGCSFTNSVLGAVAAGDACTLSATLVGGGSGSVTDALSFLPSSSTLGSLSLTGTLSGIAVATSTSISVPSPSVPVYASTGTEVTFTVTVAPTSGTAAPAGTVAVTVDSTTTNPTLVTSGSNGVATVTLSGLTAGLHTISAVYATSGSFTGSNSGTPQSFTIATVPTSVAWTPGAITQQVSQAIGSGVLDATVMPAIPGSYVYTATPSGGLATGIDASSYLGIGSYALAVTFYPNDSVDYAPSTASVPNFSITKATATPSAGASTNVVAADGTGNYTSLSAALAALPVTGGAIYLKPGTYTGQNAISYPNVSLRGLGGDATKVILTAEDGAFSSPFTGYLGTGTGSGNASASGDQGSSTLDVTKSAYMGQTSGSTSSPIGVTNSTQYTPNNFYAEYLTIQNTYNTDAAATSTYNYSSSSGLCTNTGTATPLNSLYNSGTQCNSQALALWIESDQAVLNNVNLISQQDTLYAGSQGCGSTCTPARQYMWKGNITGDVDYVFGDAALAFDHTNFFTTWHGTSATGTETIEAQNKKFQTGSSNDYLSGYICNGCTLLSQSTGMTNLYYGRPYGSYSTWIMLNSFVDQVNPVGWIEFSGDNNLPTSTYAEYNTQPYTDPAVGTAPYPATLFGGSVTPTGGNIGAGVNGARETTSQAPGTLEASNSIKTSLTAAEAAQYFPVTFLSTTVPTQAYPGFTANWNPTTALANAVNAFAPAGNITLSAPGASVTILTRPQTPGAGLIPTGTYTIMDSLNSATATVLASGTLDASGEAYLTTSALGSGVHTITVVYNGDTNFTGGTSAPFTITVPAALLVSTTTSLTVSTPSTAYGGTINGSVSVTAQSGGGTVGGTVTLMAGTNTLGSCILSAGSCTFAISGAPAGTQALTAVYGGNSTYATSNSSSATIQVARGLLQVVANNANTTVGGTLPALTYTISGFIGADTQATATTGAPTLTTTATSTASPGVYPIAITTGSLASANYNFTFTGGYLHIAAVGQAAAVATGDTRTVTEPLFPAVCQTLTASIASVNNDIPDAVDNPATTPGVTTNPDQARIQAALNACAGTSQAVRLSVDNAGHNAFLSGPLSMPSNVTLLVDPAVTLFFSRNAQDYDTVAGTHTCGTIDTSSATSSCQPLILVPSTSTNVGIMGYGKLDGRGGDTLLNAIAPYQGFTWWGLSAAYASPNSQQNPIFVQVAGGASNLTLYKITIRNSPLFHVAFKGSETGFTAWDIKIVTPTTSRNTDGIDPGDVQNATITRSWISDGDDNIAVGASGSGAADQGANMTITNNHFFAGHGQSIGSITEAGVSNILWDGNIAAGNGFAGHGSAVSSTGTFAGGANDSNSTGIRIKSANDRGGLVTNVQYSNECLLDHATDIQFTPLYNTNTGTLTPNFKNILMQNIVFVNDAAGTGTVQFTGASNGATTNLLQVTLDNATFPSALSATSFVNSGTAGTETNAQLTYGPGQVSSNFVTAWNAFVGTNGNTVTNNITAASLSAPVCVFTYLAPELTGPSGLPQTLTQGQNATAVVILTPAVGGAAYPTGTVTLTDALTSATYTATLPGTGDTVSVPLPALSVGTHTFIATYSGDSNYVLPTGATYYAATNPYTIVVNSGALSSTTTTLSGVPAAASFGTTFTATATVTGSSPSGTVQFVVAGGGATGSYTYATFSVVAGSASATLSLPFSASGYTITAIYSGDVANAGSTSSAANVSITAAQTITLLSLSTNVTPLGHPVLATVTVSPVQAVAGTPVGTVSLSYTTATSSTAVSLGSATLSGGVATIAADLPIGIDQITATYAASGSFAGSVSSSMSVTVGAASITQLSTNPVPLAYTITTLAGGGAAVPSSGNMACAGATDKYGDGCLASTIAFTAADDLRGVSPDPFGNIYVTDISATRIRRISPNGIITTFAGGGSTCTPPGSTAANGTGCVPTTASLSKPRGVSADSAGNIFIADYSGNKVYEVRVADGLMYLVAGTGTAGTLGDGGPAVAAQVDAPRSAWSDAVGDIYIADTSANKVRVVDTAGNIHTFAGTGTSSSTGDGGLATAATISNPQGITTDANLNVYVADAGKVRVICVTCGTGSPLDTVLAKLGVTSPVNGDIYTIAGSGATSTYTGTLPTLATNVSMSVQKLAMDIGGNLYISDSNGFVWFLDFHTGYIRAIASAATSVCAAATDAFGDGCPATQAKFGSNGGNGFGAGVDVFGNVYIGDTTNLLVRKVITGLTATSTAVGSTQTLPVQIHFNAGDSLAGTNGVAYSSNEWSLITPTCITNADSTSDCLFNATFAPAVPGVRSTPLTINSSAGSKAALALLGTALGSGATLDPAKSVSFGTGLQVAGVAVTGAGNVYVSDLKSKNLLLFSPSSQALGTSATATTVATLTAPGAVTVDPRGFVYVADTSTGLVTQVAPSGTKTTLATTFKTPSGLAVDSLNNLYVSDSAAKAVYEIDAITGASRTLIASGLTAPAGLTIAPSGNLLIADPGAATLYSYNPSTAAFATVKSPATAPVGVATDAAGNLLIADTTAIFAAPASANSSSFTVASITPTSIATDAAGDVFAGAGSGVIKLQRTQSLLQFASAASAAQTATLLESGNQSLQLTSVSQTDSTDFTLTATASTDCVVTGSLPSSLAVGGACSLSATYTPGSPAPLTPSDTATFNGNLSNAAQSSPSSVQLSLTGPVTVLTDSLSLNAPSPASPVYGQVVTISATVTGVAALAPAGSVSFSVDGMVTTANVNGGVAMATLNGLAAGMHSVSASFTSSNGYPAASTTTAVTFSVAKATSGVTLSSNPTVPVAGLADVLSATVTGAGTLSGSVVFSNGTTTLCTTAVSGVGIATCSFTPAAAGSLSLTAQYQGDANHSSSTASLTLSAASTDFTLTLTPALQTANAGGSTTYTITATGVSGTLYGPVALTEIGLPSNYTVSFSPSSMAGGAANTSTLTIVAPATIARSTPQTTNRGRGWLMALALPFCLLFGSRFKRGRYALSVLLLVTGLGAATCVVGCSSGSMKATPVNYNFTVSATGLSTTHTTTAILTVEPTQ